MNDMDQMDAIAHLLDADPRSEKMRRAALRDKPRVRRRTILLSAIAGLGTVVATGAGVVAVQGQLDRGNLRANAVEPLSQAPKQKTSTTQVWAASGIRGVPVMAPGGTGGVIDESGHVRIVGAGGEITASADVTPEAALVAGLLGKDDVVAWTTGRIMSWWTKSQGVQRVEHSRPLGLTSVAGGILVFDDEDWSGRLSGNEVVGLIAGNDALTIGVQPDGTSLAATVDGVITRWSPGGDMRVLQPTAPQDGFKVRRVAGLFGGNAVLVWEKPGDKSEQRSAIITCMDLEDASTVSRMEKSALQVAQARLVRSRNGASFGPVIVSSEGKLSDIPQNVTVVESAGDYLAVKKADGGGAWLDVDGGRVRQSDEGVSFRLSSASTVWIREGKKLIMKVKEQV